MTNEQVKKLFDYLCLDINNVDLYRECGYLTENIGSDGRMYWFYMDEFQMAAINEATGEIIGDPNKLDALFC